MNHPTPPTPRWQTLRTGGEEERTPGVNLTTSEAPAGDPRGSWKPPTAPGKPVRPNSTDSKNTLKD